jgi:uncharacterized protein YabN with tetrapyrrole methylase and pyrophosphatase domain
LPLRDFQTRARTKNEDLRFALVAVARAKHLDPESGLDRTNMKFMNRFADVEKNGVTTVLGCRKLALTALLF